MDMEDNAPKTYKEILIVNPDEMYFDTSFDIEFKEGDITVHLEPSGPTVMLSDEFRNRIKQPWENSVVVKLWGRPLGYKMLCNRIMTIWKLRGHYKVIDLDNGLG
ncbi:conserved hypothetical protein [Ricinus communis]|uniref:DUF4283 domain-containing protein n=1 Tax=Ricinus communis TaxID=3988 RepID=B9RRS0_RICCO|nr:conserved hypothetical protein [Ricinus communis]